jgi:hypothetical protein
MPGAAARRRPDSDRGPYLRRAATQVGPSGRGEGGSGSDGAAAGRGELKGAPHTCGRGPLPCWVQRLLLWLQADGARREGARPRSGGGGGCCAVSWEEEGAAAAAAATAAMQARTRSQAPERS